MRLVRNPKTYWVWTLIVVAALGGAYPIDPYVFGFVSLGLAWATGGVAVLALVAVVLSRAASARAKVAVCLALLVAGLAIALSLQVLGGFHWA